MPEGLQIVHINGAPGSPTLRDIAAVFFRHRRLLLTSFSLVLAGGVFYFALFPSYKSEMKVLVRRGRIDPAITPTPSPSPAFEHDEITEEELNSEVELLRDDDILRQVVIETGLAKANWLSKLLSPSDDERTEKAVRRLAKKLDVQPVRKSRLISVSYSSSRPQRSAVVLRSLARAYLARHAELHRPSGEQSFFEIQTEESRRALEKAQAKLITFTRTQGIASAEVERDITLQKLGEAQASELGLETETAGAAERARILDQKLQNLPEHRVVQVKSSDNPQLQEKLKSKLLELELRRTELLTKFQPSYRLVEEVDQQIAQAKAAIAVENAKPLRDETTQDNPEYEWAHAERLKSQVELADLRQKELAAREQVAKYRGYAEQLEETAILQRDLEQNLKLAEDRWMLYSKKREEARIGDALDQNGVLNVAVAQEPRAPAMPVWPFWTASCLSLIGACGVSTGLVFAADYFDPSFRTPEEVVGFLGAPVLAALPGRAGNSLHSPEAS
jgi:uncharacterized protein involved in exopolysaccharide biosynthesis